MERFDERSFAPSACDFWQTKRIPKSPFNPRTPFLRWFESDTEANYYLRGNKDFSVESVGYHFNDLGYRGESFEHKPGEVGAMFLGDSNTFGVATPWENLWTTCVVEHLQKRWGMPVRQFNLAFGGTGTDYTAMMVHQTVEILNPAVVFILWSYINRITWFPNTQQQVRFFPFRMEYSSNEDHSAYLRLATEAQGFFNFVRNFHLVNDRLLRLGIPFYWGTLDPFSVEMLTPYLPLDGYVGCWSYIDLARDSFHSGLPSHAHFASLVISAMDRARISPAVQSQQIDLQQSASADTSKHKQAYRLRAGMLNTTAAFLTQPIRKLADSVRVARRVRALKRKDPFIY